MPNPWMPGLRHDPGLNAGYRAGRNRMYMVVDHWTAGRNSYGICKDRGLCQILLPKVGAPWQFSEIDAKCWHAGSAAYGDYNGHGPGLEVERLSGDEPLTHDQRSWLGRINAWMAAEWGVPNVHYWGPRFPWHGANFHGHVNHAQVHPNEDGVSPVEWASLGGPGPPDERRRDVIYREENGQYWEMGLGDYVLLPDAVGIGAGLNGATIVPIKTAERIAMGIEAGKQGKAFLRSVGLID